jgi:hypothetical protein
VAQAKDHGKLAKRLGIPEQLPPQPARRCWTRSLHPWTEAGLLPDFPFGTDLTADELRMVRALKKLKHASHHPSEFLLMAVRALFEEKPVPKAYLERLGLDDAHSFKDLLVRRLFANNVG